MKQDDQDHATTDHPGASAIEPRFFQWLTDIVAADASDLHLTVGTAPWIRQQGRLRPLPDPPLTADDTAHVAAFVLSGDQWRQLHAVGEIDFAYSVTGLARFRMNIYRQRGAYSVAIRVIPSDIPRFTDLGLPSVLESWTARERGLIVVTGPTGSGKSTTLAALLEVINHRDHRRVITLEDPIEYLHHHRQSIIDQREIGSDTLSFSAGLRVALRQDPDVLLVGEMRDLETMRTTLAAAETGHLVLTTLHTMDAAQTVHRMVEVFEQRDQAQIRSQLAGVLVGIVSQRLIPAQSALGRIAVTEVLVNTPAVSNVIRTGALHQLPSVMQTGRQVGMHTLSQSLQHQVQVGHIQADERAQWMMRWGLSSADA